MNPALVAVLSLSGIVVLGIGTVVAVYNRLVALRNWYRNAFSQIDIQLKRRYDLIPNLVETARAYLHHERETLEAVIAARNHAAATATHAAASPGDARAMEGLAGAESALTSALGRLFALVEAYPDLKANQNMLQLSEELVSTENRIAYARQAFNDAVTAYNTACEVFPASLIAGSGGFRTASLLVFDSAIQNPPRVSFA